MSRLFFSPKDYRFISDVTKELMKDVIGAKVNYYRINDELTTIDPLYNDAKEIVYDDPIEIDVFIKKDAHETATGQWGREQHRELKLHFHQEDLLDRDLKPRDGDVISFGDHFYELLEGKEELEFWGIVEFIIGMEFRAKQLQDGKISATLKGPVQSRNMDFDPNETDWEQSRGKEEFQNGQPTGDSRKLFDQGLVEKPKKGNKISVKNDPPEKRHVASFYDGFYDHDRES